MTDICVPGDGPSTNQCPPGEVPAPAPVPCGPGEILVGEVCEPAPAPVPCGPDEVSVNGTCEPGPAPVTCGPGEQLVGGVCSLETAGPAPAPGATEAVVVVPPELPVTGSEMGLLAVGSVLLVAGVAFRRLARR